MADSLESPTSPSLLGRLQHAPTDQAAWNAFVERYGRKIYGWCRRWGLQDADAQEVTQNVLMKLAEKMRTFAYDSTRSFRAWLKTLTHHAWQDLLEANRRAGAGGSDGAVLGRLESREARDALVQELDEEFRRELLEKAMARVKLRVQPHTWEAFRLQALAGLSGAEAAARLGIKVATAYVARSKVQKMLQEEMHKLETRCPEPREPPS